MSQDNFDLRGSLDSIELDATDRQLLQDTADKEVHFFVQALEATVHAAPEDEALQAGKNARQSALGDGYTPRLEETPPRRRAVEIYVEVVLETFSNHSREVVGGMQLNSSSTLSTVRQHIAEHAIGTGILTEVPFMFLRNGRAPVSRQQEANFQLQDVLVYNGASASVILRIIKGHFMQALSDAELHGVQQQLERTLLQQQEQELLLHTLQLQLEPKGGHQPQSPARVEAGALSEHLEQEQRALLQQHEAEMAELRLHIESDQQKMQGKLELAKQKAAERISRMTQLHAEAIANEQRRQLELEKRVQDAWIAERAKIAQQLKFLSLMHVHRILQRNLAKVPAVVISTWRYNLLLHYRHLCNSHLHKKIRNHSKSPNPGYRTQQEIIQISAPQQKDSVTDVAASSAPGRHKGIVVPADRVVQKRGRADPLAEINRMSRAHRLRTELLEETRCMDSADIKLVEQALDAHTYLEPVDGRAHFVT